TRRGRVADAHDTAEALNSVRAQVDGRRVAAVQLHSAGDNADASNGTARVAVNGNVACCHVDLPSCPHPVSGARWLSVWSVGVGGIAAPVTAKDSTIGLTSPRGSAVTPRRGRCTWAAGVPPMPAHD